MPVTARWMIASAVGGLMILGTSAASSAQSAPERSGEPVTRIASFPPGSIQGTILDEKGEPVAGAVVSALGGSTLIAVSDRNGRFELRALPPGPYLVRAHLAGFVTPAAQVIQVRSNAHVSSAIALRHVGAARTVLAAGFGPVSDQPQQPSAAAAPAAGTPPGDNAGASNTPAPDDGETAWRIRHTRRSILKDINFPAEVLARNDAPAGSGRAIDFLGRAAALPARAAMDFFESTPFSGQVNLLTTTSFDAPQQLFAPNSLPSGIANLSLTAPVGNFGDWAVRAAFTQADMAAWMFAGTYATRAPARHQYNLGLSYSAQRFDAGNPLVLNAASSNKSASEIFAFDTFTITPAVAITAGSRLARYDYVDGAGLMSPRVELAVTPADHLRVSGLVSRSAQAPGAEEFLPPSDEGIWLPPQRLFSTLDPDAQLRAERTTHAALQVERDVSGVTLGLRAFHQHTDDQIVTLFGASVPDQPMSTLGHYFVANAGNTEATGCAASVRAALSTWLRGSVEYSMTDGRLTPTGNTRYLLITAPSTINDLPERIHDVQTTIEARVPETSTRVMVLYRISNGFTHGPRGADPASDGAALDSRFDVQIHQSLPFMNFTSAKWEMLVAVRNFFREPTADGQSVYDELLVVRPPKRIVGGLTMHF
jgi:hypothetical protein